MRLRSIAMVCAGLAVGCAAQALAQDEPCSGCEGDDFACWCTPDGDWVDETMPSSALVGIDTDLDDFCVADVSLIMDGPVTMRRYPPAACTIAIEIVDMVLVGRDGVTLTAGAGKGNSPLQPSVGIIVDEPGAAPDAVSTIDVYFELEMGEGEYLYNHEPLQVAADIFCVPPPGDYIHVQTCVDLYDYPKPTIPEQDPVARLTDAIHVNYPSCGNNRVDQTSEECDGTDDAACRKACREDCTCPSCGNDEVDQASEECDGTDDAACPGKCTIDCRCGDGVPTLPEWGLVGLGLLLLVGGTIIFVRRRTMGALNA